MPRVKKCLIEEYGLNLVRFPEPLGYRATIDDDEKCEAAEKNTQRMLSIIGSTSAAIAIIDAAKVRSPELRARVKQTTTFLASVNTSLTDDLLALTGRLAARALPPKAVNRER